MGSIEEILFEAENRLNYLTHLFFSGPGEEALLGSLLGDFDKGNPVGRCPPAVADAIFFHRKIDSYSDRHIIPRRSRKRISPARRRFAGVIVDVVYDHFLSRSHPYKVPRTDRRPAKLQPATAFIATTAASISASVVNGPRLKRTAPFSRVPISW